MSTQIRGNKQIKNITIGNEQISNESLELNKLKQGTELVKRDGSVAFTGNLDLGNNQLKNIGAPVDDNDAVRKSDLDAVIGGSIVTREVPTGTVNGVNTQFTLVNEPNIGTEQVFLNGALLNAGANSDYVLEGSTITFTLPPQEGDAILVNYISDMIVVSLDINTSINQLNTRLTTAEGELFTAQNDITSLDGDVSALDSRVTTAEADIVSAEGNISSLQASLASVQSNISTLQTDLSDEEAARIAADDAFNSTVGSIQTSVTSLGNRMNTAEGDITALEAADAAFDIRAGVIEDGLQAETNARTSADNALSTRVTALENAPDPVTALSALSDVTLTSPSTDQILKYNGTNWVNGAAPSTFSGSYTDLSDKPDLSVYALGSELSSVDSRVEALEDNAFVTREVPSGVVDGSNAVFTLANTPVAGSEQVFVNGLLQAPGAEEDYTISGSTITFVEAPLSTYKIHVSYATGSYLVAPGGSGNGSSEVRQESNVFSWPGNSSGNPTEQIFTHNYGTLPDRIEVLVQTPGGGWVPALAVHAAGAGWYGFAVYNSSTTQTSVYFYGAYWSEHSNTKIRCTWF